MKHENLKKKKFNYYNYGIQSPSSVLNHESQQGINFNGSVQIEQSVRMCCLRLSGFHNADKLAVNALLPSHFINGKKVKFSKMLREFDSGQIYNHDHFSGF